MSLLRRAFRSGGLVAPLVLAVFALGLRLYRLSGRSLTLDETFTAIASHVATPADVVSWSQADINGMPLFYLFTWFLARFGDSEALLRLPSAVAGSVTVVVVYRLGTRLFGVYAGLAAALLTAVLSFSIWFSQDARNYSFLMLMTSLQMLFAYEVVARGRIRDWAGLTLFTSLNLYTHYVAFAPTAAAAVYVGIFVTTRGLARARGRMKVASLGVVLILAAAMASVRWRAVFAAATAHRLRAAVVAVLVVAAGLSGVAWQLWRRPPKSRQAKQFALALGCAACIVLSYAPWLPSLRIFVSRPDQSVQRYDLGRPTNLADVGGVVSGLDVTGILLVIFAVGLVGLAIHLLRGREAEALLLVSWIAVSVLVIWLPLRGAITQIEVRYFAFLFPAAMLVIGAGVDTATVGLHHALESIRRTSGRTFKIPAPAVGLALVAIAVAQPFAGITAYYEAQKNDFRGVATHIAAASPQDALVLAIGRHPDIVSVVLSYYFHRLHSPIEVVDARQLDSDVVERMADNNGAVWAVLAFPSQAEVAQLAQSGREIHDFPDVTGGIHAVQVMTPGLSPTGQAEAVLRWEEPLEPELRGSRVLLELLTGKASPGPNLVSPPGEQGWQLSPGTRTEGATLFLEPTSTSPERAATYTAYVEPQADYVLSFDCMTIGAKGEQQVFATFLGEAGRALITLPSGSGYLCPHAQAWKRTYLALPAPPGASAAVLLFRFKGGRSAQFRDIQLVQVSVAA